MTGYEHDDDNESVRSRRSRYGRYRAVANGSSVDESLFGETISEKSKKERLRASKGGRGSSLRDGGKRSINSGMPSTLIMSRSDIEEMKSMSVIKTKADLKKDLLEKEKLDEVKYRKTRALKARMKKLEEEARKHTPKTEMELIKEANDKKILANAALKRREAMDDVKTMNQMMQYAQCVSIRDMQVKEKELKEKEERKHERKLDIIMEIDRLKLVKQYDDAEFERTRNRIKDRSVITVQIEERKKKREEEKAALRREAEEMIEKMKKQAEEEAVQAKKDAEKSHKLLLEVQADNEKQISYRKLAKQREVALDLEITAYNKAKDEKARLAEAEKEALAKSRELQIAKLRALQEKTSDKQAALDALRAKRAAEASERAARKREYDEQCARKRSLDEMNFYRNKQQKEKVEAKILEIKRDRELYERNRQLQIENLKKIHEEDEKLKIKNMNHSAELRRQIKINEEAKSKARSDYLESGKGWKIKVKNEMERINEIKNVKVESLKEKGVPEKYLTELSKYDPEKILVQDYKRG